MCQASPDILHRRLPLGCFVLAPSPAPPFPFPASAPPSPLLSRVSSRPGAVRGRWSFRGPRRTGQACSSVRSVRRRPVVLIDRREGDGCHRWDRKWSERWHRVCCSVCLALEMKKGATLWWNCSPCCVRPDGLRLRRVQFCAELGGGRGKGVELPMEIWVGRSAFMKTTQSCLVRDVRMATRTSGAKN